MSANGDSVRNFFLYNGGLLHDMFFVLFLSDLVFNLSQTWKATRRDTQYSGHVNDAGIEEKKIKTAAF